MAKMKITISLDRWLLDDVDALAKEQKTTRTSIVFSALKEYVDRYGSNELLLKRINAAYADFPDPTEDRWLRFARRHHRHRAMG